MRPTTTDWNVPHCSTSPLHIAMPLDPYYVSPSKNISKRKSGLA